MSIHLTFLAQNDLTDHFLKAQLSRRRTLNARSQFSKASLPNIAPPPMAEDENLIHTLFSDAQRITGVRQSDLNGRPQISIVVPKLEMSQRENLISMTKTVVFTPQAGMMSLRRLQIADEREQLLKIFEEGVKTQELTPAEVKAANDMKAAKAAIVAQPSTFE